MILLVALLLGLLVGWLLSRGQKRPYELPTLRHVWLIPTALAVQLAAIYAPGTLGRVPASLVAWVLPLSLLAFLVFCLLNWRIPGMPVLMIGLALNLAVITANGGWMPISPETASQLPGGAPPEAAVPGTRVAQKDILMRTGETRLELLADRYLLPDWLGYRAAMSLGDMFVAAGAFWLLASPTRKPERHWRENAYE